MSVKKSDKKSDKSSAANRRRHMRFPPPSGSAITLTWEKESGEISCPALLIDESYTGCSLVLVGPVVPFVGSTVQVTGEKMPQSVMEIRWCREIDTGIVKLGLEYS